MGLVNFSLLFVHVLSFQFFFLGGRGVAQSVEREAPGEKVSSSIPAVAARSLQVESVSV